MKNGTGRYMCVNVVMFSCIHMALNSTCDLIATTIHVHVLTIIFMFLICSFSTFHKLNRFGFETIHTRQSLSTTRVCYKTVDVTLSRMDVWF